MLTFFIEKRFLSNISKALLLFAIGVSYSLPARGNNSTVSPNAATAHELIVRSLELVENGERDQALQVFDQSRSLYKWEDDVRRARELNKLQSRQQTRLNAFISCSGMEILRKTNLFVERQGELPLFDERRYKGTWKTKDRRHAQKFLTAFKLHVENLSFLSANSEYDGICLFNNARMAGNTLVGSMDTEYRMYLVWDAFKWAGRYLEDNNRNQVAKSAYLASVRAGLLAKKDDVSLTGEDLTKFKLKNYACKVFFEGEAQGLYNTRRLALETNDPWFRICVFESWWRAS